MLANACPCPASRKPKTIRVPFQKAAAGKWKWDLRHCEIHTLLKCRLNSLQISAQVSCIIFYQDCISASVCMTLPVLNRTKACCCCQSCFKLNIHLLLCGCHFLSGVQKSIPLPTRRFPTHRSGSRDFGEDKLRPGCFSFPRQRKGTSLVPALPRKLIHV